MTMLTTEQWIGIILALCSTISALAVFIRWMLVEQIRKTEERAKELEAKLEAERREHTLTREKATEELLKAAERTFRSVDELAEARKELALRGEALRRGRTP